MTSALRNSNHLSERLPLDPVDLMSNSGGGLFRISRWLPSRRGGWRSLLTTATMLLRGCGEELRSLLYRIRFEYRLATLGGGVGFGPLVETDHTGVHVSCKRTLACIRDSQNFLVGHPWATDYDRTLFRDAWMAGARWNLDTQDRGTSGNIERGSCDPPDCNSISVEPDFGGAGLPAPSFFPEMQPHLVTLLDMIQTETWNLVNHASGLTRIRDDMKARYHMYLGHGFAGVAFSDTDRQGILLMENIMRPWLNAHGLRATIDRLDRIMEYLDDPDRHIDDMSDKLTILIEVMEDELRRRVFLFLPPQNEWLYREPEKWWAKTIEAFPSATHDALEAGRCYALGRYTACVFHCMGVLQAGLYAMAIDLKVPFNYSIELAEWNGVIAGIEAKIEPLRNMPKSDKRDEMLSFFSQCAAQFRYFKDAWRNHVAHMRKDYSAGEAWEVLEHVHGFMEQLSTNLKE